ncbi:MAG: PAS domain S-box protein [Pseudomonadota bacterium]
MIFIDLIYNLALLVALSVVSGFIGQRWKHKLRGVLIQGVIFGGAAVIGMLRPLILAPGLIFDGRSVMISLCGLFFGPAAVTVACAMALTCRILQGGIGAIMGVSVILSSALLGLIFHFRKSSRGVEVSAIQLFGFGLIVHVVMILLVFVLPEDLVFITLKRIGLPVMLTYPLATVLIGKILSDHLARERSQAALRDSEVRYRELVENANSIILRMDAQGTITYFNEFAQRFFGFQEEELLGRHVIGTIVPPTDSSGRDMVAMVDRIFQDPAAYPNIENENICRNGERVWIAWTTKPVFDEAGKLREILCIGNDITALKRAKDANASLLSFQNEMLDTAAVWINTLDMDGNVTFWNHAAERISGYFKNEVRGHNAIWEWLYPDPAYRAGIFSKAMEIIRKNERVEHFETLIRCKSGAWCTISWHSNNLMDEYGKAVGSIAIGVDITERKRNEEERTLLSTVIEQAEENVLITDHRRTIIYINPAFERSSGYHCDELKGQKLKTLRSDQHDEDFYQTTKEILDRGQVWMGVIINKGKGGINFEIEGTISPIRNTSGAITHFVAVGRNMNRFRRLERELHQAQKLDALGTLAGGIAHDFNNVLTAIMGLIEMEALDAGEGSRSHERMAQALSACCRARDLIKQILAFSRQSDHQRKPIEMGSIVEDAVKMLRASIPTTIDIRFASQDGQSVIVGDPTQIHQVIVNLCTNAAHAMRDTGGILKVSLDHVEIDAVEAAEHLDQQPGTYVRLVVGDTGHGMDRKTLDRIFEPFFTTKAPGEGAGIGLSVVHGIAKSHGGRIAVYSEPGEGSNFEILFPRTDNVSASVDKPKTGIRGGTERIFLVDDEEILIDVVTAMLKILGYEVVSAKGSRDALQLFQSQCDRFHLVITDLTMPEMTGLELAAEMLRIRGGIPIILSTGFTSAELREKAMAMGIREVMMKPFVLQELAQTVRRILDGQIQSGK